MGQRTSEENEKIICKAYLTGDSSINEIAGRHGVSFATVNRVLTRNSISRERSTGPRNKIKVNERFFEFLDTPEKAYWLGFIIADGSIHRHKNGGFHFALRLSTKDQNHLEMFKMAVESSHTIVTGKTHLKATDKYYDYCAIKIVRKSFVNYLSQWFPFPKDLADDLLCHFVRGYFDGDGSWTIRRKQIAFSLRTAPEDLALWLQNILIDRCDVDKTKIGFNTGAYRVGYEGNSQCLRIFRFMYEDGGPFLARKYCKSSEHFNSL